MATDTNVEHLVINKMTQAQYDSATKHADELYLTPDETMTVVGSGNNICWKYPDGTMIAMVKKTQNITFSAWGGIYESEVAFPPNFAQAFVDVPFCTVSLMDSGLQCWVMNGSGRTSASGCQCTKTRGQGVTVGRAGSGGSAVSITLGWIAIGRWK